MIRILVVAVIVCTLIFGCKKSTEPEQEADPLVGTWNLGLVTDDINNFVGDSQGIDGVIMRMDLAENGTGQAYVQNGDQTVAYSCTWNTSGDQFDINLEGRGDLSFEYEIMVGGKQTQDVPPPGSSLILTGSNQFATYIEVPLVFYYLKS